MTDKKISETEMARDARQGLTTTNEAVHEREGKCGFFACEPRCLQACNNIRVMVFLQCVFAFFEGFVVNGVINVILVQLEVRYRLSSKLSGLIASGNDFGAFFVLLFIGHIAEQRHKPKFMAGGVACMAVGSLVFVLPHFLGGKYMFEQSASNTGNEWNACSNMTAGACDGDEETETNMLFYGILLTGQVLLGIGSSPMFTVGLTYVDESSQAKMTSFFTALIYCSAAVGVAAGYAVAGQTLSLYVDVDKVDMDSIHINPSDPRWVGAWWIGIVAGMIAFLFVMVPFCAYPRRLPGYNKLKLTRQSEAHGETEVREYNARYEGSLKDFPRAFLNLVKNPTFVLLCTAGCLEALIIAGTATFGAKLFQQLFHVDIQHAGMLMGIITVPGAGGGMILGGCLVKKFNLRCSGIIKLCGLLTFLALLISPAFLARCPEANIVGVTVPYPDNPSQISLTSKCNEHCACSTKVMEPICVKGELSFFSPCHAGCNQDSIMMVNGIRTYRDCTCLKDNDHDYNVTDGNHALRNASLESSVDSTQLVKPGICTETCSMLYVFCALCFLIMLLTFSTMAPNITAVMRCVRHDQRSFAVGLQILACRLLGTTPGPVLFGAILDSTCLSWQGGCSAGGSCWVYDISSMGLRLVIWWACIKSAAVCVYLLAHWVYTPPVKESDLCVTEPLTQDQKLTKDLPSVRENTV